jgi:uncharacterized Zn-binding protein involved in type VI secretion
MVTGIVPHVGGPILPPAMPTVLIGGLPAARVTDMAVCVGPPDMIVKGSMTVLIGNLPAARMGDQTVHGGVIVMGCFTVMIGDAGGGGGGSGGGGGGMGAPDASALSLGETGKPGGAPGGTPAAAPSTYGKAIKIEGDDAFKKKTIAALDDIKKTPTGAAMLADLEKSGKTVTIKPTTGGNSVSGLSGGAFAGADGKPGKGSDSTVLFNPDRTKIGSEKWETRPPALGLAHELVHADHAANGTIDVKPVANDSKPDPADPKKSAQEKHEEVATVGIPPLDKGAFTENKMRAEWDPVQPERKWY